MRSLRSLLPRARRHPPDSLAARLDEAERLLGPLVGPARAAHRAATTGTTYAGTVYGRALASAGDAELRAAGLWALRRAFAERHITDARTELNLVGTLSRRKLGWTAEEIEWAVRAALAAGLPSYDFAAVVGLPLAAAARLPDAERDRLRPALEALRAGVDGARDASPAERHRARHRIDVLLGATGQAVTALPPSLFGDGDAFGPAIRAGLGSRLEAPGVPALLCHAATAPGPAPSRAWLAEGRRLLDAAPTGHAVLRDVLARAAEHREELRQTRWMAVYVWVHETTARLLRGLVALAAELDEPWVTPLLGDLAVVAGGGNGGSASAPRDLVVANAAVAALGRREDGVPQLARAQARLKHRGVLNGVTKALEAAARRAGTSRAELLEATVPGYGLGPDGRRTEQVGEHLAELAVCPPGTAALRFRAGGGPLRGVPAAVRAGHGERLAELKAELAELKKTLATQRLRVEGLLALDRRWPYAEWARHYRDHPVVRAIATGLLWQVDAGDGWRTGRLVDGRLTALDGAALPEAGTVRLWHPVAVPAAEVAAWREHLLAHEARQPFKQVFREIYPLTPAEAETATYSNRFAAHVIRAPQAQALMRARGWAGNALGYWDGGYAGRVTKEFGDEWRAEFLFDLVEQESDGYDGVSLASSDQVRFAGRGPAGWEPRPLADVPPLVFSEAMRDVDLFVGVTSIAADPGWADRAERPFRAYWTETSFGELGAAARVRREALERLVPRLRIADRCTLTERFLEVRGSLRSYRIHLGSGHVLMAPNDEYLCIVPARGTAPPTVYLPFEEDGGLLAVILSKAFLLAADAEITDRTITRQITRR